MDAHLRGKPASATTPRAVVDWAVMQATPFFAEAYSRASPPIQRAVQRAYVGITPEGMMEALGLLGWDAAVPQAQRSEALKWAEVLGRAGVVLPKVE